ncbi:MAG: cupin domain-containing protein [Chitinophagaceae bacterium]|jgi:predicted cupin superfamily sugar epimerase|nr:cupin domain-containing protein [Chitinophagaceae bacterium]
MIEQNENKIQALINHYNLLPHPEGGFFRQTYAASEQIAKEALPERFEGSRSFSTAIYFLLPTGSFSAFHRIKSDEVWHFYEGCPLNIHVIHPNGQYDCMKLGDNMTNGESYQLVVPANTWFASEPIGDPGSFALVGCTVAPGFDFADFELAEVATLTNQFPKHEELIRRLCR